MKKENKVVLSISLLCSGRNKEELVKCLKSLMTIRKSLPSEIIVVDTGCDEESHAILEKYADQVVNFTWCDDFAKARNAGLEKCAGEWFMFIDDDEWFENTDNIVRFFTSGEYNKYGSARYKVRNYSSMEGIDYSDFWASRMVKMQPNTHFHGKIHEFLEPVEGKVKLLDAYVHHYGYVYNSQEEKYAKARRNIKPLREMVIEEPGNLRWRSQLVQEYLFIGDYEGLMDVCENAISIIKDIDTPPVNRHRSDFYVGMLKADNELFQYDKTIRDFNEFKKDNRQSQVCQAAECYYVKNAYNKLKDYENTYRYTDQYIQIRDKWIHLDDYDDRMQTESSLVTRDIFLDKYYQRALSVLIYSGVKTGNVNVLHKYFAKLDLDTYESDRVFPICESVEDIFKHEPFDKRFVSYADALLSYEQFGALLIDDAKKTEQENDTEFKRLVTVYGQINDNNDWYILYLKTRYYDQINDHERLKEEYYRLLTSVIDIFSLDKSVWKIAEKWSIDQPSIFKKINYDSWKVATDSFLNEHSQDRSDVVSIVDKIIRGDNDVRFRYFRLKEKEMDLINTVNTTKNGNKDDKNALIKDDINSNKEMTIKLNMAENKKILDALPEYCHSCVSFYRDIYTQEWFTGDMTVLPPQCRFAVRFLDAIDIDNKINSSDRIKELEKCVDIYVPFIPALGEYIKEYGEREKAKLLQIQKNPELEKVYQMLDLLRQAMELQEKTGSEELQAGIMQQRQLVESMLANILSEVSIDNDADNGAWLLSVENCLRKDGDIHDKR